MPRKADPAEEDLEVVIPEDVAPNLDANGEPVLEAPKAEAPAKVIEPEEGLETLKAQLAAERTARAAAEHRANEQARQNAAAQGNVQDTNLQLVTNAIGTLTQQLDMQEAQYGEALAMQDFGAAAKIQRGMSETAVKLQRLEEGKLVMERAPKPEAQQQITDPVEQFAANLVSEGNVNSAAWIKRNPVFVTDQRQYQRMVAAANLALANGLQNDSPAFIDAVEQTLGLRQSGRAVQVDDDDDDVLSGAAAPAAGRRVAPPAAPVTRGVNGTGSKPRTMRLTPAELEAAEDSGMTPEEYALQKARIERERVH